MTLFDDAPQFTRREMLAADERAAAKGDALIYGTGFLVDGKHVSPLRVQLYRRDADGDVQALSDARQAAVDRILEATGYALTAREAQFYAETALGIAPGTIPFDLPDRTVAAGEIAPLARTSDPSTSHRAARDVAPRAGSQRHRLLEYYGLLYEHDFPGATAEQACEQVGLPTGWRRVSELEAHGYLEPTGHERKNPSGSDARLLRITRKGLEALR